ncbi:ribonuclease P protein component [Jeotgalibacillus salarius]|uniref:Ribonuclease P protein component n=1 Tax=Jeotgalibacillus salarius TaxID=546023 RepID=A0A4Y8LL43_9BACL|nr:ribonuclease P protein component [Jeotgalibacillus salarius]TFE01435.1 ribonuclease P protein component [Jeotgalibacillus salarius]
MKKEQRIKKNPEFQAVFKKGTSMANRQFVLYRLKKQDQKAFRLGMSVSKKVGNAVMRVQIKRYIRQVFHELSNELNPSYDYVVIARKPAADLNFHETKKSLTHVLKKSRVLKSESSEK